MNACTPKAGDPNFSESMASPRGWPEFINRLIAFESPETRVVETHVSWVLLTGDFAYKIKKPLNLGFLDFSTPEKRHQACLEELRLNRRLAPSLYLDVVPIGGSPDQPRFGGLGPAFDYAVKMRQFPPEATFDLMEEAGKLNAGHIERVALRLAHFHQEDCARAPADSPWGEPDAIWRTVAQNFEQLAPRLERAADRARLDALERWSLQEHARLTPLMKQRKLAGFVRECHGDLHLGNLAWVDEAPLIFDCIEFSAELRWIDAVSEIAFCYMDLMHRGHANWAWLFLNAWLEITGDYAGIALLRYYAVYRALVRAKVSLLRASQAREGAREAAQADARAHLELATALTAPPTARLDITHGLSGSGKSTATRALMQNPGAIRLRSDVERKRLAGLDAHAHGGSSVGRRLYAAHITERTYERLDTLAGALLDAGWPVIVDATFIKRWQRDRLRKTARDRAVAFRILDFPVAQPILRERIASRARAGNDASEAGLEVLLHQVETEEPLEEDEMACVVRINSDLPGISRSGLRFEPR
ncbi:MAG: AAA family ATPase [Thiobacillus sp.]|nr:AAA family ATPase [Thiobacillus sp.]